MKSLKYFLERDPFWTDEDFEDAEALSETLGKNDLILLRDKMISNIKEVTQSMMKLMN